MSFANAALEPRVRRLVAERLGVSPEDLIPEASLADELAVDSLDLLEIAIALEADLWRTCVRMAISWTWPLPSSRRPGVRIRC